jgi:single stranded DNA-binding protein
MNNQVTLCGHVGNEPQATKFEDTGNQVVKFSLAVKEFSPNTDQVKTLWFDVDCWNGLAERVLETVTKGREVVISGRLSLNSYTKEVNGVKVPMTKPIIKLTGFHLCGPKPKTEDETQSVSKGFKLDTLASVRA